MPRSRTTPEPEPDITICEGCGQRLHAHSKNRDWYSVCMATEGIESRDVRGHWECCKCSRTEKSPPSQPAHTDDTHVMMFEDAANKIAPSAFGLSLNIVPEALYMPCMADHHGDHSNTTKEAKRKGIRTPSGSVGDAGYVGARSEHWEYVAPQGFGGVRATGSRFSMTTSTMTLPSTPGAAAGSETGVNDGGVSTCWRCKVLRKSVCLVGLLLMIEYRADWIHVVRQPEPV